MSAWGTAIGSNDEFQDIYDEFFERYNNTSEEPAAIAKYILAKNAKDFLQDTNFKHEAYFAVTKALWQCKSYDIEIFNSACTFIKNGENLEQWRQLGASKQDLGKRQAHLDKFLQQIQIAKDKPTPRKKKKNVTPHYNQGDCISIKLSNSDFGSAIVLAANHNSEYGENLIALLDINQETKPVLSDFEKANITYHFYPKPSIGVEPFSLNVYHVSKKLLNNFHSAEIVGNLKITPKLKFDTHTLVNLGLDGYKSMSEIFDYHHIYFDENNENFTDKILSLKPYLDNQTKPFWKFW